ncbi:MAG TPA: hypothetical protein DD502_18335 [Cupriavidus sp.]|nr:hypothetical protein [Cupriavidus sp.]
MLGSSMAWPKDQLLCARAWLTLSLGAYSTMYKTGYWLIIIGFWLALAGVFLCDPVGGLPENVNLFSFALHGLEIHLFKLSEAPQHYLFTVLARDWLIGCFVIMFVGAVLLALGWRRRRQSRLV